VDVDFILNRGAMGTVAGLKFQSLIQVSDSLSLTRVDVPVSATSTSLAGLWVGDIVVNAVDQILGNPESPSSTPSAAPTPTPSPTPAPAGTSSPFTMRVIVHIDAAGHATLLQQAYAVIDTSLLGVVDPVFKIYTPAKYKDVAATAKSPVRLSSAAFPIDMEVGGTSNVAPGATVPFETIVLPHNAATNPFVHPYHPAHDNYDATFRHALGDGEESYMIKRDLTFAFASGQPGNPAWGSTELSGIYTETLKGLRANAIHVTGVFSLKRVAIAPILVK
jgi:hypothetical protein